MYANDVFAVLRLCLYAHQTHEQTIRSKGRDRFRHRRLSPFPEAAVDFNVKALNEVEHSFLLLFAEPATPDLLQEINNILIAVCVYFFRAKIFFTRILLTVVLLLTVYYLRFYSPMGSFHAVSYTELAGQSRHPLRASKLLPRLFQLSNY